MKKLSLENPAIASLVTFFIIFIGGSFLGFILGLLIMWTNTCEPKSQSDPCDGAAMAAGMIWSLSFMGSLILGIIVGLLKLSVLTRDTDSYRTLFETYFID